MSDHNVFETRSMIEAAVSNDLFYCDNCFTYSKKKGKCDCGAPNRRVGLVEIIDNAPVISYTFNNNMTYLHSEVTFDFNNWTVTINTEHRCMETHDAKYGDERITLLNDVCFIVDATCKKRFLDRMTRIIKERSI